MDSTVRPVRTGKLGCKSHIWLERLATFVDGNSLSYLRLSFFTTLGEALLDLPSHQALQTLSAQTQRTSKSYGDSTERCTFQLYLSRLQRSWSCRLQKLKLLHIYVGYLVPLTQ